MVTTSLREAMWQALRIRNVSPRTERTYISLVARFAYHFHRSPASLGLPEIQQYLFFLRDVKKVSWCLFNQTSALFDSSISTCWIGPSWSFAFPTAAASTTFLSCFRSTNYSRFSRPFKRSATASF